MVDHFVWEGIAWQTVYNDLNRCKNDQSILCDTHLGPPTSSMKVKLKRLANHRKGMRQHKLNIKIYKDHGDFKFQFVHDLAGADHSKPAIG